MKRGPLKTFHSTLPPPDYFYHHLPITPFLKHTIEIWRQQVIDILLRIDQRLLVILGPCSIHSKTSAIEYAQRLQRLQRQVEGKLFLIMRTYIEKPRTVSGWKGYLYDPNLQGETDFINGILASRSLLRSIGELGLPVAAEFVHPNLAPYYEEFISWGCIGARTSASQVHREYVSGAPLPFGFKNSIDGDIRLPIEGILSASEPQQYLAIDNKGSLFLTKSTGNPYTHLVLRGSNHGPNYDLHSIESALTLQRQFGIDRPILIDCAHGNSQKEPNKQLEVFQTLVPQLIRQDVPLLGIMLESFIEEGSQSFPSKQSICATQSITDPCIGWEATTEGIKRLYEACCRKTCITGIF